MPVCRTHVYVAAVFACCTFLGTNSSAQAAKASGGCVAGTEGCENPDDLLNGLMGALKAGIAEADAVGTAAANAPVREKRWREGPSGTKVVLGQRPTPKGKKFPGGCQTDPSTGEEQCIPPRDLSGDLYAGLMQQIQDKKFKKNDNVIVQKLLALSLCHAKPRSKNAWESLASIEMSLPTPSFFSFLRANLIVALLEDEVEWWEEEEDDDEDYDEIDEENDEEEKALLVEEARAATAAAVERSQKVADAFFSKRGKYNKLKRKLEAKFATFGNNEAKERLKASDYMFESLTRSLVEWAGTGSHEFPPIGFADPEALPAPAMWTSPTSKGATRPGEFMALFSTPIYVVNLMDSGAITAAMNDNMANAAVEAFEEFAKSPQAQDPQTKKPVAPSHLNDMFWSVQQQSQLTNSVPEVAEVMKHMYAACAQFAEEWGMAPETTGGPLAQFSSKHSWFSVHGKGSIHVPHVHFDARFAVVYYPRVGPEDEGRLVFEDPRGAIYNTENTETCKGKGCNLIPSLHAPFAGNRYYHTPRAGDLIIFPGWLYHSVDPVTATDEYRVSLSFNMDGYWTQTVP